jgi:hypothetical protein
MKTIYKYELAVTDKQVLKLPHDAWFMRIEQQGVSVMLWALVDTDHPTVDREIRCFGTGHPLPDSIMFADHIGTVQMGTLVWHFFDFTFGEE